MKQKYNLITRSDFDGLVCAVLLKDMDMIDQIKFVHPKDMQDGLIEVDKTCITTNLPYNKNAYLVFDHHESETIRNIGRAENHIIEADSPSAARVVYNYYSKTHTFRKEWDEMMAAVDKADSAQFTYDDIMNPQGWELLSFLMDARTGLGRFRDFTVSNYQLMMMLIDECTRQPIEKILQMPDVVERIELYRKYEEDYKKMIKDNSVMDGEILIIDLRNVDPILPGNRFVEYVLFPEAEISIHVMWGVKKQNTVFATGKSIIKRGSPINIGQAMLKHGGGGHFNAGTCQVPNENADEMLKEVIRDLRETVVFAF